MHSVCDICIHESPGVSEGNGELICLPLAMAPDQEQFLGQVLDVWKRQKLGPELRAKHYSAALLGPVSELWRSARSKV